MNLQFSKISQAIAAVFWFWRHDPKSLMLAENQPKQTAQCVWPDCGHDTNKSDPRPGCNGDYCPTAMRESMNVAAAGTSAALRDGSLVTAAKQGIARAKRIRPPRTKPLEPSDIVAGGEYVPKRGNNRTPNIIVERTTLDHDTRVRLVRYRWRDDVRVLTDSEFLSLVARRVENE